MSKLLTAIACILACLSTQTSFAFSVKDYVPRMLLKTETILIPAKEYTIDKMASLEIKNINGDIIITAWDKKDVIAIDIVKNGTKEELDQTTFAISTKQGKAVITSQATDENRAAILTYTITAPAQAAVKVVSTKQGDISIKGMQGSIQVSTQKGSIDINDSTKTIVAKTAKGAITIKQKALGEPNSIFLEALRGNVTLSLPQDIQATLQANTLQGVITSKQEITLQPMTMKLNKQAWERIKREVQGTIGVGGAPITIDVTKGNISFDIY